MRIAPIDVAHKHFARKMMGYDADEVGEFLRDVADQMEELVRERNSLKEQMRERELAIHEYKMRDETLRATITTATKMSEQIRQDAEREGKLIVNDANQKAEMIVRDARDSLKRIYQEIADSKRMRLQFDVSMRSLIHAHLAMLDQGHMMVPDPSIPQHPQHPQHAHHTHQQAAPTHASAPQMAAQAVAVLPAQQASIPSRPPSAFINRPPESTRQ